MAPGTSIQGGVRTCFTPSDAAVRWEAPGGQRGARGAAGRQVVEAAWHVLSTPPRLASADLAEPRGCRCSSPPRLMPPLLLPLINI